MIFCLIVIAIVSASRADPLPTGGAPCLVDLDCWNNLCQEVNTTMNATKHKICVCDKTRGNPDCSYSRMNRLFPGLMQLFFSPFGFGSAGQFILGNWQIGLAQLIPTLFLICMTIPVAATDNCLFCCVRSYRNEYSLKEKRICCPCVNIVGSNHTGEKDCEKDCEKAGLISCTKETQLKWQGACVGIPLILVLGWTLLDGILILCGVYTDYWGYATYI